MGMWRKCFTIRIILKKQRSKKITSYNVYTYNICEYYMYKHVGG